MTFTLDDGDTIETAEQVHAAPVGTVALDNDHYWMVKLTPDEWACFDSSGPTYFCNDEVAGVMQCEPDAFLPLTDVRTPY